MIEQNLDDFAASSKFVKRLFDDYFIILYDYYLFEYLILIANNFKYFRNQSKFENRAKQNIFNLFLLSLRTDFIFCKITMNIQRKQH